MLIQWIALRCCEMEIVDDAMWKRQREYHSENVLLSLFCFPHFDSPQLTHTIRFHFRAVSLHLSCTIHTHTHTSPTHIYIDALFSSSSSRRRWEWLSVLYAWRRESVCFGAKAFDCVRHHVCKCVCVSMNAERVSLWCLWHSHERRVLFELCWEISAWMRQA